MSAILPEPLAAYFAAKNTHDIDAMLCPFADDATVKDEGREHHGFASIRAWMEDTTTRYRVTAEVEEIAEADGSITVTARISGSFPGSPIQIQYMFTLVHGKIARLVIN
jgi:hypothetical protein